MSLDREDLIRRSYADFRDGDLGALLAVYQEDAIWDLRHWEGVPDPAVFHGHAGLEELLSMLHGVFGELDIEPVEITPIGDDRALVQGSMVIRGQASGAQVVAPPFWQVIAFRDRLISHVDTYTDEAAARRVAG